MRSSQSVSMLSDQRRSEHGAQLPDVSTDSHAESQSKTCRDTSSPRPTLELNPAICWSLQRPLKRCAATPYRRPDTPPAAVASEPRR